jgi:flagellar hook-associated protein 3 FlgL
VQLTSFPDLLSYSRRNRTTAAIKARLDIASQEAVTGLKADLTEATGGRTGNAHLLSKALNEIEQGSRINALSSSRLDMLSQGISGARNALDGIDTRAIVALNSEGSAALQNIAEEARANLSSVLSSLQAKQGTRNLFSGNAPDAPPFASAETLLNDVRAIITTAGNPSDITTALDTYFDSPTGGFQSSFYTGGTGNPPPMQIGDGGVIDFELRGDNQSIKDTLRGLAVMATAESSGFEVGSAEYSEIFSDGISAVTKGTSGFIALEGNLGIFSEILEKASDRNNFEALSLNAAYQSLVGRDQFEAAAELKQLEVQLESSYIITSRLSDLSLTNYLR